MIRAVSRQSTPANSTSPRKSASDFRLGGPEALQNATEAKPEAFTAEMREYWHGWLTTQCMRFAANLNLVPPGEKRIGAIPGDAHVVAARTVSELVAKCCRGEVARGGRRTERLHDAALRELWQALRRYAVRGANYVEHLIGSAEVRQDFLRRIGEDEAIFHGEPSRTNTPTQGI